MLNYEQSQALEFIKSGHSCVVLGQAGTGKSYLIKETLKKLNNKNVSVTASTGLAARQFTGATTIHHWAGLMDGRFENQHLLRIISEETRNRIKTCNVLIIDEISMISRKVFEQLEFICRSVKDPSLYFGGLQVVCVGDFFQLPPVPNDIYRDPGDHAFASDTWRKTVPHIITLKTVIRQSDKDLILAINELERGVPSHQTNQLMLALERPLSRNNPCVLFGTNFEVDCFNMTELHKMQGESTSYVAEEEGEQKYLRKMNANKVLLLKEGAPVMLIRNLSDTLVNGLLGTVFKLEDDGPTVKFEDKIIKLSKVTFSVYDPSQCITVAERKQYPICLAFAMTVHKSQGLTLPCVIVD
nr:ATP-dependent DNA helicase PIF1-like [Crassostrea gigas]